jgi:hypothetical protein
MGNGQSSGNGPHSSLWNSRAIQDALAMATTFWDLA